MEAQADENSSKGKDNKENNLSIEDFELNLERNKKSQALYYFALIKIIDIYNEDEGNFKDMKIYVRKDLKIMLTSITEEIIEQFLETEILLRNLINGKTRFYSEYNPDHKTNTISNDKNGNMSCNFNLNNKITKIKEAKSGASKSIKSKKTNKSDPIYGHYKNKGKEEKKTEEEHEELKIEYNLKHMAAYFNGIYFEEIATQIIFDMIDQEVILLPRMIFYMNNNKTNTEIPAFYGYNELDLAFIPTQKDIEIKEDRITCFKNFKEKASELYNLDNSKKLTIKKNELVIFEFKSRWESLKILDKKERNKLGIFLKKALEFIRYYKSLNLIEENKKIILIYLYNNNITYNYKEENKIIMNEYKKIESERNIELYIAFLQPYIKIINMYKQSKKLRDLKQEFEEKNKILKEDFEKLEEKFEIQKATNKKLEEEIEKLKLLYNAKNRNEREEKEREEKEREEKEREKVEDKK